MKLNPLALSLLVSFGTTITKSENKADKRPNIMVFMVDDMGFSDPGCLGGEIHTPNIDFLATHGDRFTQFYNCARFFLPEHLY